MKNRKVYIALIISMIFWGFSFVWAKVALETYSPISVVLFRLIVSSVAIFTFVKISNIKIKLQRKDIKYFILLAFFEPFLYFVGETFGLQRVSATTASVIISTIPIFVPIFAYILYREKLGYINIIGSIISFSGVLIIIFNKNFSLNTSLSGVLLMMLAVSAATGYSLVVKNIAQKYNPIIIVLFQSSIAIFGFLPLFFFFDFNNFVNTEHNSNSIIAIVELGIFASSIAFILFAYGIKKIGISKAGFFSNLIPIFTAIIAFFLLNEQLSIIKYIGIGVVILGLFLSQINSFKIKFKK